MASAHSAHTEAADIFLLPNMTFVAELLIFLIILGIIGRYVLPPAQRAMRERQEMVRKQLEDTEAATQRLADAERAYQDALHDARSEAAKIREDARAEAQRTVDELRGKAQEEAARIVARGEDQLAGQRAAIVRDLRSEVGSLAVELSGKIVDQPLDRDAGVAATVDSFLAGISADEHARSGAET